MSKKTKTPDYSKYTCKQLSDLIMTGLECLPKQQRSRERAVAVHNAYMEKLAGGFSDAMASALVKFEKAHDTIDFADGSWRVRLNFELDGVQFIVNFCRDNAPEISWRPDETGAIPWGRAAE